MNNRRITNLAAPQVNMEPINKSYLDSRLNTKVNSLSMVNYLRKDGTIQMTGN